MDGAVATKPQDAFAIHQKVPKFLEIGPVHRQQWSPV